MPKRIYPPDEDIVRGLARQILQHEGYSVLEASRDEEALSLCATYEKPIHLLLTDVVMPETSGKEVADQLRTLRPETKVLLMTGYTDEAIVDHGSIGLGRWNSFKNRLPRSRWRER